MIEYLQNIWYPTWDLTKFALLVIAIGLVIERIRPAEKNTPLERISFNFAYGLIFIFTSAILIPPAAKLVGLLTDKFSLNWLSIQMGDSLPEQIAQAFAFLLIFDFFYYWFHRFQHTFSWFWAQHKLHHSEQSVNISTSLRHHWLEEPIRQFLIFLPMGIVFNVPMPTYAAVATSVMLWGYFIHMNLRLPLGWFTPILAGPQLHRVHHSLLPQHQDKNFAAFFPIYDVLFGTYFHPARDEYPETGLSSGETIDTLSKASISPFREWANSIRGGLQRKISHD